MKGRWAVILSGWLVDHWLTGSGWLVVHLLVGWSEGSVGWHVEVFCRLVCKASKQLVSLSLTSLKFKNLNLSDFDEILYETSLYIFYLNIRKKLKIFTNEGMKNYYMDVSWNSIPKILKSSFIIRIWLYFICNIFL